MMPHVMARVPNSFVMLNSVKLKPNVRILCPVLDVRVSERSVIMQAGRSGGQDIASFQEGEESKS